MPPAIRPARSDSSPSSADTFSVLSRLNASGSDPNFNELASDVALFWLNEPETSVVVVVIACRIDGADSTWPSRVKAVWRAHVGGGVGVPGVEAVGLERDVDGPARAAGRQRRGGAVDLVTGDQRLVQQVDDRLILLTGDQRLVRVVQTEIGLQVGARDGPGCERRLDRGLPGGPVRLLGRRGLGRDVGVAALGEHSVDEVRRRGTGRSAGGCCGTGRSGSTGRVALRSRCPSRCWSPRHWRWWQRRPGARGGRRRRQWFPRRWSPAPRCRSGRHRRWRWRGSRRWQCPSGSRTARRASPGFRTSPARRTRLRYPRSRFRWSG